VLPTGILGQIGQTNYIEDLYMDTTVNGPIPWSLQVKALEVQIESLLNRKVVQSVLLDVSIQERIPWKVYVGLGYEPTNAKAFDTYNLSSMRYAVQLQVPLNLKV